MTICVFGLWHLGCVTAACLADAGEAVVGLDPDPQVIGNLTAGKAPLFEPGLDDMIARNLTNGRLSFTTDPEAAVGGADLLWVAFDTPVDDDDRAQVDVVIDQVVGVFPHLRDGAVVAVSSQLPVGSVARLEAEMARLRPGASVTFASIPENLRLGQAIHVFTQSDRYVLGVRDARTRSVLEPLLARFTENVLVVSVESAEMTKHATNSFLANCVTFINEIASLCEVLGADAGEVEACLRAEPRIGKRAYIRPGGAFAGGTLARDVTFLSQLGARYGITTPVLSAIGTSNDAHKGWWMTQLHRHLSPPLSGRRVAVLGLTYKPGTDTLRRSLSIELCRRLVAEGARVTAFDPAVPVLPPGSADGVELAADLAAVLDGAEALVVATEWPEFRKLDAALVTSRMARPLVIDQNRFLSEQIGSAPGLTYVTLGKPI